MRLVGRVLTPLGFAAFALPVSNLALGTPASALTRRAPPNDALAPLLPVLARKCAACHTKDAGRPFYASLPLARSLVGRQAARGLAALDLEEALFLPNGEAPRPATLDRLEARILDHSMPPPLYLALHWDDGLTREEKARLVEWIEQVRSPSQSAPR